MADAAVRLAWITGCSRQRAVPGHRVLLRQPAQLPLIASPITEAFLPLRHSPPTEFRSELRSRSDCSWHFPAQIPGLATPFELCWTSQYSRRQDGAAARNSRDGKRDSGKGFAGEHDPGYLRVTLVSIVVNGKSIALQTSSIFAKGGSYATPQIPDGQELRSR